MFNKCSFHSSIYRPAADNSASSLCAIICFLNLVIECYLETNSEIHKLIIYLFSQNNRIRFSKLPLKILFYISIFSYPELMCEQYVTFIKPGIYYGQVSKKHIIYSTFLSKNFKFQLLLVCW
ncbi:CLLU1 isoform 3 [Pongo abelii]|uniref:CLLU1 isoform 3 n=1 Tax=Pongo abelii TaxID=9601 RepID=A0A2J8XN89_PONAB|nr:CLLU1 isoform 3 [Pongo abelii]